MIEKLSNAYSPSAREEEVRNIIINELSDFYDNITVDDLGNLIIHKPGKMKKIALAAPMDEVGFLVTHTKEPDILVTTSICNVKLNTLQNVLTKDINGDLFISDNNSNLVDEIKKAKNVKFKNISNCKADILDNKFLSKTLIYDNKFTDTDKFYVGKALERSVCCSVLCNLARILTDSLYEYYFVFSSHNYCDKKGAFTATYDVEIDELYNLCCIDDSDNCVSLSKGPVVIIRDKKLISSRELIEKFEKYDNIQKLVTDNLICEGGIYQNQPKTDKVISLGIPVKYLYSPNELICKSDIDSVYKILQETVLP